MEKHILTNGRKFIVLGIGLLVLSLLAGCSGDFSPIDESTTGFFNEWIVYPFHYSLNGLHKSLVVVMVGQLSLLPFYCVR